MKEKFLKVGEGFPNLELMDDEIIIPESFAEYFSFPNLPLNKKIYADDKALNLTFDLVAMASNGNKTKLQEILISSQRGDTEKTKGQRLLVYMGYDENITLNDFMKDTGTDGMFP